MEALAELPFLAAALVCLGLGAILVLLVYALFHGLIDILNLIPKVNIGTAWLNGVKNAVWHALGVAYHGIDRLAGWQFHQLARLIGLVWREFKAHATVIAEAAATLAGLGFVVAGVRALVHHLAHHSGNVSKAVKALEKEWHGIEHRVKSLEKDWTKGIGHDLRIEVGSLDKELGKLTGTTIPAIQADVGAIPGDLADARTWVTKNFVSSTQAALEAAVAVGLTALGLSGLRCPGFLRLLSKRGCGLGGLLDALLGLAIAGLALESVCEFLPLLEDAFGAVAGPIVHLLNEVPLGDCETLPDGWSTLSVRHGPLPPAQTLGAFPA